MPKSREKKSLVVKKVPLDYYPERFQSTFPSMPILYLELLENKQKVKKDLRNKDYVPPVDRVDMANVNVPTTVQAEHQTVNEIDKDFELKEYEEDNTTMKKFGKKNIKILDLTEPQPDKEIPQSSEQKQEREEIKEPVKEHKENRESREKEIQKEEEPSYDEEDERIRRRLEKRFNIIKEEYKSRSREDRKDHESNRSTPSSKYENIQSKLLSSNTSKYEQSTEKPSNSYSSEERTKEVRNNEEQSSNARNDDEPRKDSAKSDIREDMQTSNNDQSVNEEDSETHKKLLEMFSQTSSSPSNTNYSFSQQPSQQANSAGQKQEPFIPPTLSQINNGVVRDNKGVRDITRGISKQEEEEEIEKRNYLDKFAILKRKYKDFKMPEMSPYTDVGTMKRTYDSAVKQLHLDSSVETYKKYLIGGFSLTQWAFTKFLKLDMTGFAEQQILSMNQYEQILVEIGEKSYFKAPSQMSPELKLVMLIGFNAVIFIISKMIFKASGDNILSSINKMAEKKEASSQNQKPHMKGPSMDDLNDLENMIKKSKKE
jgi:hypothetical protein